jgi:uncharacterized protein
MPYLIDGHNLIGQLPDISLDDPNDEAMLVQKLSGFVARTRKKVVVVFDGGLPGGASRLSTSGVKVVFASHLSNADKIIIERVQKSTNPKNWIVVSSDNEVLSVARRYQMQTVRSTEFVDELRRPSSPSKPGVDVAPDVHLSDDEVDDWMTLFRDGTGGKTK